MKLSNYTQLPADIPVIAEDDIFLYPFMIAPIFLSDNQNIDAATKAIDENSLVIVVPTKPTYEGKRDYKSLYNVGVVGSIMRKVMLPDGRVKILFQGLARGELLSEVSSSPLIAHVDTLESDITPNIKIDAIVEVLKEKVKKLSSVSNYFPVDLLRTIEDSNDYDRVVDLIASSIKLKKESAYKLYID